MLLEPNTTQDINSPKD